MITQTLYIKNMICDCCIRVVDLELKNIFVEVNSAKLGEINISYNEDDITIEDIESVLSKNGFLILVDNNTILIEDIKRSIIDLVHFTTFNAMVRNSDYLVGKFGKTYPYLSSLFSKHEGITLEKYIILQKIEKVKSLIQEDEVTLSEIAFMMGYSSVQYLSTQFKSISGISVSEYKKSPAKYRKSIDSVHPA